MDKSLVLVAGVDEVGRGPLAGPVIAAAVVLDPARPIKGLCDSKQLSATRREELACQIQEQAQSWALGRAEVFEIDTVNILQATLLAMQRALVGLSSHPDLVLVDGLHCPQSPYCVKAIIRGDRQIAAISAASIIAKVSRDAEMQRLDQDYPGYDLAQNKGYATAKHLLALQQQGVTPIHRCSFKPVKCYLP